MSVRKRTWTSPSGEEKTAWVVDYRDTKGARRHKTFARKKDADKFAATAHVEVREGTHVADSASVTVAEAARLWITTGENTALERSTIKQRRTHVEQHIKPFIGSTLLSRLNVPAVREFEDRLREEGRSPAMVKKVLASLGGMLADAQERGLATRNPVREIRGRRKGRERRAEKRQKGRIRVGEHIPTREEVKAIVGAAEGRWRPLLLTAIFAGLRSSELRGLRWQDVDIEKRVIHVKQRADEFRQIGKPKSEAGERSIPIPPLVANALREWQLACPRRKTEDDKTELHYVFPNGVGNIESHANIVNRGLAPTLIAAGVTVPSGKTDDDGKPILAAKYTGLHALRHFYASWCINPKSAGGLGLLPKNVQERLGHSTIMMTLDVYGHLFPRSDDADELAEAERALLG